MISLLRGSIGFFLSLTLKNLLREWPFCILDIIFCYLCHHEIPTLASASLNVTQFLNLKYRFKAIFCSSYHFFLSSFCFLHMFQFTKMIFHDLCVWWGPSHPISPHLIDIRMTRCVRCPLLHTFWRFFVYPLEPGAFISFFYRLFSLISPLFYPFFFSGTPLSSNYQGQRIFSQGCSPNVWLRIYWWDPYISIKQGEITKWPVIWEPLPI